MIRSVGYNANTYVPNFKSGYRTENMQTGEPSGLSVFALYLMTQGINVASEAVSKALMRGKEYTDFANVDTVVKSMIKDGKLNDIKVRYINPSNIIQMSLELGIPVDQLREVANGQNAFFSSGHKAVVAPSSKPSLIQHELGHAINAKKPIWRALQNSRRYLSAIPALLLGAEILSKRIRKTDEPSVIEKNAGLLGFAAYLPTIVEEAAASIRGIQAAKKSLGGNVKLGALRRNYFLAWLTYLLAGIGFGAATKISVKTGIL